MNSVITYNQEKTFTKVIGKDRYVVKIRYDDQCNNGHNTFAITLDHYRGKRLVAWGCQHHMVSRHFPELSKYIKWHLTSSVEPLHYIDNTMHHAKHGNLDYARSCAVADESTTLEQLSDRAWLQARLPSLMLKFREAMEELGFTF